MVKYLIYGGSKGFFAKALKERLGNEAHLSERRIDTREEQGTVEDDIQRYGTSFVINAIGKTGRPNIDSLELAENQEAAKWANIEIPLILAKACQKTGARLVHWGSGCIYQGDNWGDGYKETDEPNFDKSFYSWTKIEAEKRLKPFDPLIIRIRMPLGPVPSERNLIDKLLGYVNDGKPIISVLNSISVVPDAIGAAMELMEKRKTGIYNVVNPCAITHKELLDMYQEISGRRLNITYIPPEQLKTAAPRSNCVLSTAKLEHDVSLMPNIFESARTILREHWERRRQAA